MESAPRYSPGVLADIRKTNARARARLSAEVRRVLGAMGYEEVETPCLVPVPGM
jgi:lysyl-tRNA synthetase class 2